VNILNEQFPGVDKGWSSSLGRSLTFKRTNLTRQEMSQRILDLDEYLAALLSGLIQFMITVMVELQWGKQTTLVCQLP
jgi:hypothetical protein